MNANQFEAAAKKRNCTEDSRYLCAPDKNLTHLIEFCTDRKKSLYGEGVLIVFESLQCNAIHLIFNFVKEEGNCNYFYHHFGIIPNQHLSYGR